MLNFNITRSESFVEAEVIEALRTVMDPELGINIVDLGLIYDVKFFKEDSRLTVVMTLSSRYCPMGEAILTSVRNCLELMFKNYTCSVELTWEPVWTYDKISEEGLRQLGR